MSPAAGAPVYAVNDVSGITLVFLWSLKVK